MELGCGHSQTAQASHSTDSVCPSSNALFQWYSPVGLAPGCLEIAQSPWGLELDGILEKIKKGLWACGQELSPTTGCPGEGSSQGYPPPLWWPTHPGYSPKGYVGKPPSGPHYQTLVGLGVAAWRLHDHSWGG